MTGPGVAGLLPGQPSLTFWVRGGCCFGAKQALRLFIELPKWTDQTRPKDKVEANYTEIARSDGSEQLAARYLLTNSFIHEWMHPPPGNLQHIYPRRMSCELLKTCLEQLVWPAAAGVHVCLL